jgi:uncharacterized protein
MSKTFLTAEWRKLIMANYAVDKKILEPYLPHQTEIDLWNNTCYVSLVGFMFVNTKVKGIRVPCHVNFEEVNLRFYVRHYSNGKWRRGVVFISEIVPKPMLAFVANTIYKEHYKAMRMRHAWQPSENNLRVEYKWKKERWHSISVNAEPVSQKIDPNSEAAFITDHYWGYTKIGEHETSEYSVEHPSWEVYPIKDYFIDVDFGKLYGADFKFLAAEKPLSVFLAEGSGIKVNSGRRL